MTAATTMTKPTARVLAIGVLRLGLGALFLIAGALKWRDPVGFAEEIANYRVWPAAAPYLAAVLPVLEITLALSLLAAPRAWRRAAAAALFVVTVTFTIAVGSAVVRGLDISCGCFGGGSGRVTWLTVLRNIALLGAAGWLAWAWRDPEAGPGGVSVPLGHSV